MDQVRKKLSAEDQSLVVGKIVGFRDIHEKIVDLESKLKQMQDEKESLLTELLLARADEDMMLAGLVLKYGPGELDVRNMEWVESPSEKTQKDNEYIERI